MLLATVFITASSVLYLRQGDWDGQTGIFLTAAVCWLTVVGRYLLALPLMTVLIAPLATLVLLVQFFIVSDPIHGGHYSGTASVVLGIHIVCSIIGMAFSVISCGVSALYLWQQYLLKKKLLHRLLQDAPAIDTLNRYMLLALKLGFIFLTLGLVTGAFFYQHYGVPAEQSFKVKIIWAMIVWFWYLAILIAQKLAGSSGKSIAKMGMLGFFLLLSTYFGMGV